MQLTVEAPEKNVTITPNHPLNNVAEEARDESRQRTLGEVLAAIAGRQDRAITETNNKQN